MSCRLRSEWKHEMVLQRGNVTIYHTFWVLNCVSLSLPAWYECLLHKKILNEFSLMSLVGTAAAKNTGCKNVCRYKNQSKNNWFLTDSNYRSCCCQGFSGITRKFPLSEFRNHSSAHRRHPPSGSSFLAYCSMFSKQIMKETLMSSDYKLYRHISDCKSSLSLQMCFLDDQLCIPRW